jgi:3-dehydroquinate synthase II
MSEKETWLICGEGDWERVKEAVKDAVEIGFTGCVVPDEFVEKAKNLGRIDVLGLNQARFLKIKTAEDQERATEISKQAERMFISFEDWKVIPLENLIAMKGSAKLIAIVDSFEDAEVALTTLEKGADGIAVTGSREDLLQYFRLTGGRETQVELKTGRISEIRPLGVGERVCIDTVTIMEPGEGVLVGNKAGFMFLVASESEESEYVASRPFRVNAGSVNAYVKVGGKTRYLMELKGGDEVEIVRWDGRVRRSYVGRVKIERRPMILIRADMDGEEGTVILQNAETIKLVAPDGRHVSVSELKEGDEVLVWIGTKSRHFGVEVEEFIIEK